MLCLDVPLTCLLDIFKDGEYVSHFFIIHFGRMSVYEHSLIQSSIMKSGHSSNEQRYGILQEMRQQSGPFQTTNKQIKYSA